MRMPLSGMRIPMGTSVRLAPTHSGRWPDGRNTVIAAVGLGPLEASCELAEPRRKLLTERCRRGPTARRAGYEDCLSVRSAGPTWQGQGEGDADEAVVRRGGEVLAGACGRDFEQPAAAEPDGLALVSVRPDPGRPRSRTRDDRVPVVHDGIQRRARRTSSSTLRRRQPVARRLVGQSPLPLLAARLARRRLHPGRRRARRGGLPPGHDRVHGALHDRPHRRPRPLRREIVYRGSWTVASTSGSSRGDRVPLSRAARRRRRRRPTSCPSCRRPAAITTYCRPPAS